MEEPESRRSLSLKLHILITRRLALLRCYEPAASLDTLYILRASFPACVWGSSREGLEERCRVPHPGDPCRRRPAIRAGPYCLLQECARTGRALPPNTRGGPASATKLGSSERPRQSARMRPRSAAEPYGGKEIVLGEIADGGAAGRCEMSAIGTGTIERRPVSSHHDQRQRVARGRIRCGGTVRCHTDQSKRLQRENRLHRWGTGFGALPPGSPCALHASHMVPIASTRLFQFLRRTKCNLLAGCDLHRLACGWIASSARFALAHLQCSQPIDTDAVALLQVPRDTIDHSKPENREPTSWALDVLPQAARRCPSA